MSKANKMINTWSSKLYIFSSPILKKSMPGVFTPPPDWVHRISVCHQNRLPLCVCRHHREKDKSLCKKRPVFFSLPNMGMGSVLSEIAMWSHHCLCPITLHSLEKGFILHWKEITWKYTFLDLIHGALYVMTSLDIIKQYSKYASFQRLQRFCRLL